MQTDCQSPTEECVLVKAGSAAQQLWAAHAQPDGMEAAACWLSGPDPLRGVPVEVLLDQGLRRPLLLQVHTLAGRASLPASNGVWKTSCNTQSGQL